ncbi:MAG: DNA polymerase III subunit delta' [Candidatus Brocadiaceae bacterium]|nr:DNA polymerase III subunit delta' [Candidatus Brocadiaceae bacterium]
MSYRNIVFQNRIIDIFQNVIKNNRLAHAYIFAGPEGVGKSLFAKELAKSLFCRSSHWDACDKCNNCQRIITDNYPDLFFFFPEKNSRVIKIEQIRHLQGILNTTPLESRNKMVIIESADKMSEEASNCLLKTLEEPPAFALIVLVVTSLEFVRETIRSRCQIVRFAPLPETAVKDLLINNFQIEDKKAEQLANISNGSLKRALLLSDAHAFERKIWLVKKLLQLKSNDNLIFSKELFDEWNIASLENLEEKRLQTKEILFSLLMYYRDLLVCKIENHETSLYYEGFRNELRAKSSVLTEDALFEILKIVKSSIGYLEQNANITLLIETMITQILQMQNNPGDLHYRDTQYQNRIFFQHY